MFGRGASTLNLAVMEFWSGCGQNGPGFRLCAVPLESSGPGFCGMEQRFGER